MSDEAPLFFDVHLGMLRPANAKAEEAMRPRDLLSYDPETGVLTWKARTPDMFNSASRSQDDSCATWNQRFAAKEALASPDKRGYLTGNLLGKPVKAHRIAWEIAYGHAPTGEIDHINGNPADNRLSNLRDVSHAENGRNLKLKRTNTTGECGINPMKSGRWQATITVDGKRRHLGTFATFGEAVSARRRANPLSGFHQNHGARR